MTTDKQQARAIANRKKAALDCAKKLTAAAEALSAFMLACNECDDASRTRGLDDGRQIMMHNLFEYAGYLGSVYADKS